MRGFIGNRRGVNLLFGVVVFFVFNFAVFLIVLVFASGAGTGINYLEESYAKQIALLIDGAKPGTEIEVDLSEIYFTAREQGTDPVIELRCEFNEVFVRVREAGGYRQKYFTELDECRFTVDDQGRVLKVKV